jgi:hypothetical protein
MSKILAHLELRRNDYHAGIYTFTDVRANEGWGDVLIIVDHRNFDGKLLSVSNHRGEEIVLTEIKRLKELGAIDLQAIT